MYRTSILWYHSSIDPYWKGYFSRHRAPTAVSSRIKPSPPLSLRRVGHSGIDFNIMLGGEVNFVNLELLSVVKIRTSHLLIGITGRLKYGFRLPKFSMLISQSEIKNIYQMIVQMIQLYFVFLLRLPMWEIF